VDIEFQSAVFHLSERALVPLLHNDEVPKAATSA